ncbi:MAG: hypothetical protein HY537_00475 [Deltaproteobacteria bacterium]|nr:hypothetical protein [Deltaproteobacteria bacterium]
MKAPQIRLNTFILLISSLVISVITVVYYIKTKAVLEGKFAELESAQRQSIIDYATTVLQARKNLLTIYQENIDPDNRLAKLVLLGAGKQAQARRLLDQFKTRSRCDYIAVSTAQKARGESTFTIQNIEGKLTLLSASPLKYFDTQVGTLLLGYHLNAAISDEISKATNSSVSFFPYRDKRSPEIVLLRSEGLPEVAMALNSSLVKGVNHELRISIFAVSAVCLFLFVAITYWSLSLVFLKNFRRIVREIDEGAASLDQGLIQERKSRRYLIREVCALSEAFSKYSGKLSTFSEKIKSQASTATLGMVTAQITHDMKSDLSILERLLDLDAINAYGIEDKKMIHRVIDKLRAVTAIAMQKIQKREKAETVELLSAETKTSEPLCLLIDQVIVEKSYQYKEEEHLTLSSQVWDNGHFRISAAIQPLEFKRICSNLIDNSVQALAGAGHVTVSLYQQAQNAVITVADDGPGIPTEILPKLCARGASFGKTGGSGLGLWYAKEIIATWGGKFRIHSLEGKGTTVEIWLPIAQTPSWLLTELQIPAGCEIIVLDDDPSVHGLWDGKLAALQITPKHFEKVHTFFRWYKKYQAKERIYLIDYGFFNESLVGTQVIEQLSIEKNAVLVTGNYDRRDVRTECERLKIKLLPKPLISVVPACLLGGRTKEPESA